MGSGQVADRLFQVVVMAGHVGQQLEVHDAVGCGTHRWGLTQVVTGRVGLSQVQESRCGSVMDPRVDFKVSTPCNRLDSIIFSTLVIAVGSSVFGTAKEVGHHGLRFDFMFGQIDRSVDIMHGAVLFLLVDAV